MTERDAFIADICEHPEDDAPRLIFADWLDDHGEPDRAEFVRTQMELARCPQQIAWLEQMPVESWTGDPVEGQLLRRLDGLRHRERHLLSIHWPRWLHESFDSLAFDVGTSARDDNDFGVSLYSKQKGELGHFDCSFRRGFVAEVKLPLAVWLVHGPKLVRQQPIERVEVWDKEPHNYLDRNTSWRWTNGIGPIHPMYRKAVIGEVWDYLPRQDHDFWYAYPTPEVAIDANFWCAYPTLEVAIDALSAACLLHAKQRQAAS